MGKNFTKIEKFLVFLNLCVLCMSVFFVTRVFMRQSPKTANAYEQARVHLNNNLRLQKMVNNDKAMVAVRSRIESKIQKQFEKIFELSWISPPKLPITALSRSFMLDNVERDYGKFLHSMNLAPENLKRLKELLAQRQIHTVYYANIPEDLSDTGIRKQYEFGTAYADSKIRSEFGEEMQKTIEDYANALPVRKEASEMVASLAAFQIHLDSTQTDILTKILTDNPMPPVSSAKASKEETAEYFRLRLERVDKIIAQSTNLLGADVALELERHMMEKEEVERSFRNSINREKTLRAENR